MRSTSSARAGLILCLAIGPVLMFGEQAHGQAVGVDADGVSQVLGMKGESVGETYKVSFPRSDLQVKVGSVAIKPALALTTWAAFKKTDGAAITYGDLVLLEDELNPVIGKLEERGIEISALHNHLIHENPRILYIHFMGHGNEVDLAKGLHEALALTKTPVASNPAGPAESKSALAEQIEQIIGYKGSMGGGVLHINVPRNNVHVKTMGIEIPSNMGMNTPLNFQLEGDKAAVNGDFMLIAGEVNPVIKALRTNGIEVASLHNHMLDEEPRLFFTHFWAYDDAVRLAKGLRAALDQMAR